MISVALELFLVGFGLAALAEIVRSPLFTVASGLWFISNTLVLVFSGSPVNTTTQLFFALVGLALVYVGVWRTYKVYVTAKLPRRVPIDTDSD
jgi:hypothetical protein